ncbi:hypothetical protein OWV82_005228 [Melia azedarach]|uniref:Uncharacterized protein n=1 Tax=Melia azedarach TaxID=155640 RepID=A0ACC1YSV3_MELAZ|nr:hypothetical protein OWV82_005228 [Melia azedarach]
MIRKLEDYGVDQKVRDSSMKAQDQLVKHLLGDRSFVEGDDEDHQIQRKDLHEVHSGPNPIGNSIPLQKYWKIKRRNP